MNILLLGKGFVGSYLAEFFTKKEITFTHISKLDVDYSIAGNLHNIINLLDISHVVNCSGYTGKPNVDACEQNKKACWTLNVVTNNTINNVCNELHIPCIHVSSGCIYTGYEKIFTELDEPNFGIYNSESSYYSKSKHAFETIANLDYSAILRIRMPYTDKAEPKNYLYKLYMYDNLIDYSNSLTSVDDLCVFIGKFLDQFTPGIYNVVNSEPSTAITIIDIFRKYNIKNPNWKFVEIKDLNIIAGRSNCVLSTTKIKNLNLELSNTQVSLDNTIRKLAKCLN
jgi:dTDP-4-dehydrorhamnose reductase